MISLTINGQTLEVPEGTTVLNAAEQAGVVIPTLCHHKDLTPFGGCRLCSVDIQGLRLPATACTMPVSPAMVVRTESPALTRYRRAILELLLARFFDAGYTHSNGHDGPALDTQFAHWVNYYGIDMKRTMAQTPFRQIDSDPNPYIWVDKNKCIMCTRCVRACAEIQSRFVWTQGYRGYDLRIVAGADTTMLQARCESCGACVAHCPTGALDNKMSVKLGLPDRVVTTTCSYCGVGCQLELNVKDDVPGGRILRVTSTATAPVNGDHLCVKGRYGYDFVQSPSRVKQPRVRQYLLDGTERPVKRGRWVEVDWDTALDITADGLRAARDQHGPQAVGLLASGRCLNEENYLLNKLARQVLGTNNIDACERIGIASPVDGLGSSLGLYAQSNSLDDVAREAKAVFVIGSNTTEQHPIFGVLLRKAALRRGCKLIVAHSDFVNLSEYAALRLVYRPNTETILISGLIHIILKNGWEDRAFIENHTTGFEDFERSVRPFTSRYVAGLTGIDENSLRQAAEILAANRPAAVVWGQELGADSAGRPTAIHLAHLQMLLGNLGVPGGGLIPLRVHNNSQGASDMGGLPGFYPGYQPVEQAAVRRKFEAAWGGSLPITPGMSARHMVTAAGQGALTALLALGGEISEQVSITHNLLACDFVAQIAAFETSLTRGADVLLPSVTFAEKTGTFTSTERRVQMVRQAIAPQGSARPDWQALSELAQRIHSNGRNGDYGRWDYPDTSTIMREIATLTPLYAGISHERLERTGGLQWPVKNQSHPGTPIVPVEQMAGGRGRFITHEERVATP